MRRVLIALVVLTLTVPAIAAECPSTPLDPATMSITVGGYDCPEACQINAPTTFAVNAPGVDLTCPPATFEWNFGDGATATSSTPSTTHAFSDFGSFTTTVRVVRTDQTVTLSKVVGTWDACEGGNPQLTTSNTFLWWADDTGTMNEGGGTCVTGRNIHFELLFFGVPSVIPQCGHYQFQWSVSDGMQMTTTSPSFDHTFDKPGTYDVVMTASNGIWTVALKTTVVVTAAVPLFSPATLLMLALAFAVAGWVAQKIR